MNIKKESITKINFFNTLMSAYHFNFQNFLLAFKSLVFLLIASTISTSVAAKSEENLSNKNIYKSIFDSYEKWEWEDTSDWIISNKTVDEIGGWQYYSREKSKEKK